MKSWLLFLSPFFPTFLATVKFCWGKKLQYHHPGWEWEHCGIRLLPSKHSSVFLIVSFLLWSEKCPRAKCFIMVLLLGTCIDEPVKTNISLNSAGVQRTWLQTREILALFFFFNFLFGDSWFLKLGGNFKQKPMKFLLLPLLFFFLKLKKNYFCV